MRFQLTNLPIPRVGLLRIAVLSFASAALICSGGSLPALAKSKPPAKDSKAKPEQPASDAKHGKDAHGKDQHGAAKPEQLATFGDWGAFATHGSSKTCYALATAKERAPKAKLKDTQAYVFISTRPAENVKNEVAINLGYATKDNAPAAADIDGDGFELVLKGTNAWIKNPAEEPKFVKTLKEGTKLTVKATSAKGAATTDSYSLEGLSKALDRVQQECHQSLSGLDQNRKHEAASWCSFRSL